MKKLIWTLCVMVWSLAGFAQEKSYQLSSHILDIQQGQPAAGVKISLSQLQPDGNTVRGKALRPFLVGEIDRRGYKLLVRPCRFLAAWTADHRRDSRLQVLQHIPLLYGLLLLMPLVIEAVTA